MTELAPEEAGGRPDKEKMEALGRLSCKVAHDFNNLLGAIEGYATLALAGAGENAQLKQDLLEIRVAVAEAAAFTKQLIVFGGMQMMHKAPCRIEELIAAALKKAELAAAPGFNIETRIEPGLPGLMADAARIEQALANLLVNAREAMPDGGTVLITASALRIPGGSADAPAPPEAGSLFIKVAVRDSGAGITPEVFKRLFEPLFSTRKKRRGAGLGLSFVYGVVQQHGGWVEVKSGPGPGSEFSVFLPAAGSR